MALALLATAAFFGWQALQLPFGEVALPGPAFFPFALACVLALVAVAILFMSLRSVPTADLVFVGHRDVVITLAALCGVTFAFEQSDGYIALGVFVAALLVLVARTTLWRAFLGATLGMVAVWFVFRWALGVRLPAADFWWDIGNALAAPFSSGTL